MKNLRHLLLGSLLTFGFSCSIIDEMEKEEKLPRIFYSQENLEKDIILKDDAGIYAFAFPDTGKYKRTGKETYHFIGDMGEGFMISTNLFDSDLDGVANLIVFYRLRNFDFVLRKGEIDSSKAPPMIIKEEDGKWTKYSYEKLLKRYLKINENIPDKKSPSVVDEDFRKL